VTEAELMQHLRADALRDLERVKVLVRILPFEFLEWLDQRAATLNNLIRQFDEVLAHKPSA
jgi:hypothetical protein